MAHAILMPKPGQMTEECTVIAWHKKEGDLVRRGDVLFEIETDKSTMEVEAFDDGTLLRIVAGVGATVPVNMVCAYIGEPGEAIPETASVGRGRRHGHPRAVDGRRLPRRGGRRAGGHVPTRTICSGRTSGRTRRRVRDVARNRCDRGGGRAGPSPPRRAGRPPADQPAGEPGCSRGGDRPPGDFRERSGRTDHRAGRPRRHRDAGGEPGDHPGRFRPGPGRGCRPGSPRRWPRPGGDAAADAAGRRRGRAAAAEPDAPRHRGPPDPELDVDAALHGDRRGRRHASCWRSARSSRPPERT